jgi:hypothetical protein
LSSLQPYVKLALFGAGLDVNHAGPTADGAVLRVDLVLAAARIDVDFFPLATKRTGQPLRSCAHRSFPSHSAG